MSRVFFVRLVFIQAILIYKYILDIFWGPRPGTKPGCFLVILGCVCTRARVPGYPGVRVFGYPGTPRVYTLLNASLLHCYISLHGGLVWFGMVRFGSVRFGSVRFGLVWSGLARSALYKYRLLKKNYCLVRTSFKLESFPTL